MEETRWKMQLFWHADTVSHKCAPNTHFTAWAKQGYHLPLHVAHATAMEDDKGPEPFVWEDDNPRALRFPRPSCQVAVCTLGSFGKLQAKRGPL